MKKVLAIMLVCFMLVSMLPMGALAEEAQPLCPGKGAKHYLDNCEHGDPINHVEGVCGAYSYDVYQCDVCGDIFAANFVKNENPHVWVETEAEVPHTIDVEGKTAVETCSVCGAVRGGEVIGHSYVKTERGSCGEGWFEVYTCACGDSYEIEIAGDGHKWELIPEIDTPPSLTENGLALYECLACGQIKEVPILPHACFENLKYYEYVAAKCGVAGSYAYYECTECGDLFWDAEALVPVEDAAELIIPAEEHGHDGMVEVKELLYHFEGGYYFYFYVDETKEVTLLNEGNGLVTLGVWDEENWNYPAIGAMGMGETITVTLEAGKEYRLFTIASNLPIYMISYVRGPVLIPGDCANEIADKYMWSCEKCGYAASEEEYIIGELPHQWQHVDHLDPTCTTWGFDVYNCVLCGDNETIPYEPNGHDLVLSYGWDADCNWEGYYFYYCTACDYTEEVTVPALGHALVEETVEATCCSYAYTTIYCERCGEVIQNTVHEDLGYATENHPELVEWGWVNEPTCTKSGNQVWYCPDCREYIVIKQDALGHDLVTVTYEPTCLEVGYEYTFCTRCDYEKFDNIVDPIFDYEEEMLKHDGYTMAEAEAIHKHLDKENPKWYRDGNCYFVGLEAYWCFDCCTYILIQKPGTGTHLKPTDLVSKDEAQGPVLGTITGGDGIYMSGNPLIISSIPFVVEQGPYDDLTYAYTATEDITFSVTVNGEGYAMYGFNLYNMYSYMADAGEITLLAGETLFFNVWNFSGTINLGDVTLPEFYGQDATCEQDGWTEQWYCDRCGEFFASEVIPAYGHEWDYSVGWEATCTEPGCSDLKECKECGAIEGGEYVAPLGHAWVDTTVEFVDTYEIVYDENGMPVAIECTQQFGFTLRHCERCGDDHLDVENAVDFIYNFEPIACYHNYEEDIFAYIAPTCTELGISVFVCSDCGNTIYATDYSSELQPHENKAGQILTNGCDSKDVEDRACKWCCYGVDENGEEVVIGSIDWTHNDLHLGVEYPATCIRDAYVIDFCGACGYNEVTEEEIGTALGISEETCEIITTDVVDATVTSDGYVYRECVHCGTDYGYVLPAIPGVEYTATLSADKLTLGSQIAVTITVAGSGDAAWGFEFNVPYNTEHFAFTGYELANSYSAAAENNGVINVAGNFNGATISESQVVVVLYFEVITNEKVNGSFCVENVWTVDAEGETVDSYVVADTYEIEKFMDVNRDGVVTLLDALELYNMIKSGVEFDAVADVDGDGVLTLMGDLMGLYNWLVNN